MLTEPIKDALKTVGITTVLNLPTACIANIQLGVHASTVAMFQHSEGGKGRKSQPTLSDNLSYDKQGKLKRFWYLAHAIQLKLAGKEVQNMTTRLNHTTNVPTIELRHLESTAALQESFLSLVKFLSISKDMDIMIGDINITGRPDMWQWDYPMVEKMITESQDDPSKNDFTFKFF